MFLQLVVEQNLPLMNEHYFCNLRLNAREFDCGSILMIRRQCVCHPEEFLFIPISVHVILMPPRFFSTLECTFWEVMLRKWPLVDRTTNVIDVRAICIWFSNTASILEDRFRAVHHKVIYRPTPWQLTLLHPFCPDKWHMTPSSTDVPQAISYRIPERYWHAEKQLRSVPSNRPSPSGRAIPW